MSWHVYLFKKRQNIKKLLINCSLWILNQCSGLWNDKILTSQGTIDGFPSFKYHLSSSDHSSPCSGRGYVNGNSITPQVHQRHELGMRVTLRLIPQTKPLAPVLPSVFREPHPPGSLSQVLCCQSQYQLPTPLLTTATQNYFHFQLYSSKIRATML